MENKISIIFDCDGTLIDSMREWHEVDFRLAERVGVTFTKEDADFLTSANIFECGDYLHSKYGLGTSGANVVEMINNEMLEFYKTRARPREGALEFVRGLYELGVPMACASSTSPTLLRQGLETTGLAPYFRTVISVDDVGSSKRDPAVYDAARKHLGTDRTHTWGFEDAVYALQTLRAAGYKTCGIYDNDISGAADDLRALSDIFITSFTELTLEKFLETGRSHDRTQP